MNSDRLARTTFVLLRETHEELDYISARMGVSRSELVRDTLTEPVSLMAKWVRSLPDQPTQADVQKSTDLLQLDMIDFIAANASGMGLVMPDHE